MLLHDALILVFGLPTWVLVDGTWAALSQIALTVPEGFNISSYLMLALTSGNLFPLFIGNYLRGCSNETLKLAIRSIQVVSLLSGLSMSLFWSSSVSIQGKQYSVPLYVLFFAVGSCSASSNITHFMFISKFAARATSLLSTGFSLGSMIAGILAILQSLVLKQYGFSLFFYFLILSLLNLPAMIASSRLWKDQEESIISNTGYQEIKNIKESGVEDSAEALSSSPLTSEQSFMKNHIYVLLFQFVGASLGYGMVPSIISFACSKFEHRETVLLFATSITSASSPLFRMLTDYVQFTSQRQLFASTCCLLFLGVGVLTCALLPAGEAIHQGNGGVLPAVLYIAFNGLFGFTNTCIFRYYKSNVSADYVQHAYRLGGLMMQSGALIGSLTTFFLITSKVIE
jgi:hypothetical protein